MPKLLLSGERENFTVVSFEPEQRTISVDAQYPAPFNASWIEPQRVNGQVDQLIGLSEGEEAGLVYTFEIDHGTKTSRITSQQFTLGAPAHLLLLKDSSAIAVGTYMGGSIALYPTSRTASGDVLLADGSREEVLPPFPYAAQGHGKDPARQRQCHVHQVLEDKQGHLYAPDLGSDRIWMLNRKGTRAEICGWLQCPPGTGPRHAVINHDTTLIYVIGELSHTVLAFELPTSPKEDVLPIKNFAPNVISPLVPAVHQSMMDAAEISLHPKIPNTIYVSNRWVQHIAEREPHLKDVPEESPLGDDIAIIILAPDGRSVEAIKHVQTNLDVIRGMRLSDDGRYAAIVGQEAGGLEIYEVTGERGEAWERIAGLHNDLEGGLKHVIWL